MRIPGIPETILVAPDSFKGTLSASTVAEAIGRGLADAGRSVELCPVADGGEGTTHVLLGALGGERVEALAHDALGRGVTASFALIEDPAGRSAGRAAVVETAAASGLQLLSAAERDAFAASTYGTGELIAAAIAAGARTV